MDAGITSILLALNRAKNKQGGILISQNSFTHLLNIQMTFRYAWILMKIFETIKKITEKFSGYTYKLQNY